MVGVGAAADDLAAGLREHGRAAVVASAVETAPGNEHYVLLVFPNGRTGPVANLDAGTVANAVEAPLRAGLQFLQQAHAALRDRGGSVVLVVPTIGLEGAAAGYVPWATVAEGLRALAKSAARVWGVERVTVNCVAVPAALLLTKNTDAPDRAELAADALPAPSIRVEVAGVVASLLDGAFSSVTGQTIAVDGGGWMAP